MEKYRFQLLMDEAYADCWTGRFSVERGGQSRMELLRVVVRRGFALLPGGRGVEELCGDYRVAPRSQPMAMVLRVGRGGLPVFWHTGSRMPHTRERALFALVPQGMGLHECSERFREQMERVQMLCGKEVLCSVRWQVEHRHEERFFDSPATQMADPFEAWDEC
ncbi:MAG: hypothetical protein IJV06_00955 [Bacteroidaceae bacterium]|nr:hypothetical protein [Bacteroidaceae bacterium]